MLLLIFFLCFLDFSSSKLSRRFASECFYRGGFYQYFEGGPRSRFFSRRSHGFSLEDGEKCFPEGKYCRRSPELDFWYPCKQISVVDGGAAAANESSSSKKDRRARKNAAASVGAAAAASTPTLYSGCYFGRGPLQVSGHLLTLLAILYINNTHLKVPRRWSIALVRDNRSWASVSRVRSCEN